MSQLKQVLSFSGLVVGTPMTLAHALNWNGNPVKPDRINANASGFTIAADLSGVTVTRVDGPADVDMLLESWHTIERAFGSDSVTALVPQPFVTQGSSGSSGGGGSPPFQTSIVTIFARTTGSDTTGNGSLAAPYRTFQRAMQDVPAIVTPGTTYVIDITGIGVETLPENYQIPVVQGSFWTGDNSPHPFLFNHLLNIRATPQLASGIPAADAVITAADAPVRTSDPNTNLVIVTLGVARASWGAGALKGKHFIRTTGTSQTSCTIYDSNTTQLFLCNRLGSVPALGAGEEFHIVEPSATLEAPPSTSNDGGAIRCMNVTSIGFQGIQIRCATPGADVGINLAGASQPFFELCDLPDGIFMEDGQFQIGLFSTFVQAPITVSANSDTFSTRRCYFANVADFVSNARIVDMLNTVFENCAELGNDTYAPPPFLETPVTTSWSMANVLVTGSAGEGLHAQGGKWSLDHVEIKNSAINGINAEHGSNYVWLHVVTGTGNAGVGVLANDGAQVQITDATTTTLTGTGGNVKSGNLAVAAYAPAMNQFDITAVAAGGATGTGTRIFERA